MSVEYKNIFECSQYLKNNGLVAFPTETVYGLGANALNNEAVSDIFKIKERPKTDPIIVHIHDLNQIHDLIDISEDNFIVVKKLADNFWPGPLTLLLKASKNIPNIVTADTGLVGIRIPNNEIALKLLRESNLPIAAPSANKFEHISPTKSFHVEYDFKDNHCLDKPLYILEDSSKDLINKIGIESTIVKIDFKSEIFKILRPGYITVNDITQLNIGNFRTMPEIVFKSKDEKMDSSGQSIKHYSTDCHTILVTTSVEVILSNLPIKENIAIIDTGNICNKLINQVKYYDNLSLVSDVNEMMNNFYSKLRDFELFYNKNKIDVLYIINNSLLNNQKYDSLFDRMYRSSSGNYLKL
jgi:L-threonylcarbamoyladenylate synthase